MVKKTTATKTASKKAATTTKKKVVTKKAAASTPKKTTGKKVTVRTASTKKSTPAKKAPVKKVSEAAKAKVPVPSPVRKVAPIEEHQSAFNATWIVIIILSAAFIAGLGWWVSRDTQTDTPEPTTTIENAGSDFSPSVQVIGN